MFKCNSLIDKKFLVVEQVPHTWYLVPYLRSQSSKHVLAEIANRYVPSRGTHCTQEFPLIDNGQGFNF